MGPLMFSLGIRPLLRDLASALGPDRLILAYLDDIYILSPNDWALEQKLAFFDERQPSIRLNQAKFKSLALEDIRTNGLRVLGTCVGARSAREQFLEEKIDHEAAIIAKLHQPAAPARPPSPEGLRAAEPTAPAALSQIRRPRPPLGQA
jgi:hypothetical protein